jgi:hypothetical protein
MNEGKIKNLSSTFYYIFVWQKQKKSKSDQKKIIRRLLCYFFPWFGSAAFLLEHWETLQIPLQHGFNTASSFDILLLSPFHSYFYHCLFFIDFLALSMTLPFG